MDFFSDNSKRTHSFKTTTGLRETQRKKYVPTNGRRPGWQGKQEKQPIGTYCNLQTFKIVVFQLERFPLHF